ncbi:hypothetical protein [Streptomyces sp. SID13726]|uniref:hypothetical protein n=1 Tax=Streptomyces sp. SID13726 TaxID=2706058 RepID=UPI0013BBC351|nr:hypothetical protein [Streptomyces sp. SID13726]NEA99692.1 hypothetical protein [Streptomyces sp. SID13726]
MHTPYDTTLCLEELREALALHGITLPSLRVGVPSLIALGDCDAVTAREIAAALRKAAVQ